MKKFATVWRVERENGEGMYTRSGLSQIIADEGMDIAGPSHPTPFDDFYLGWPGLDYSFGFASLAQFRQWVYKPRWRRALHQGGFILVKYTVPVKFFRRSQYQACFDKYYARKGAARRVDYLDKLKGD